MIKEGEDIASWHRNIIVKVPLIAEGLKAVKVLTEKSIKTNVTLCFTATQALLAAKAGATYVSPFVGRLDDISTDGMQVIRDIRLIYDNYGIDTQILTASARSPMHFLEAARIGSDRHHRAVVRPEDAPPASVDGEWPEKIPRGLGKDAGEGRREKLAVSEDSLDRGGVPPRPFFRLQGSQATPPFCGTASAQSHSPAHGRRGGGDPSRKAVFSSPNGFLAIRWAATGSFLEGRSSRARNSPPPCAANWRRSLAFATEIGAQIHSFVHAYPDRDVRLHFFMAHIVSGDPKKLEVADLRWVTPEEFGDYQFPDADLPLLDQLRAL